jgi:hypothetical protein
MLSPPAVGPRRDVLRRRQRSLGRSRGACMATNASTAAYGAGDHRDHIEWQQRSQALHACQAGRRRPSGLRATAAAVVRYRRRRSARRCSMRAEAMKGRAARARVRCSRCARRTDADDHEPRTTGLRLTRLPQVLRGRQAREGRAWSSGARSARSMSRPGSTAREPIASNSCAVPSVVSAHSWNLRIDAGTVAGVVPMATLRSGEDFSLEIRLHPAGGLKDRCQHHAPSALATAANRSTAISPGSIDTGAALRPEVQLRVSAPKAAGASRRTCLLPAIICSQSFRAAGPCARLFLPRARGRYRVRSRSPTDPAASDTSL